MRARNARLLASLAPAYLRTALLVGCTVGCTVGCAVGCTGEQQPLPMTQGVTEQEHDAFFPIGPTDHHRLGQGVVGMDDMSCSSCHAGTATFAEFTCLSCHARSDAVEGALDIAHASARGYTKADASCYTCHPRGEAIPAAAEGEGEGEGEPFDHLTDAFPLPHGDNVGCVQCHPAMPDYSQTGCAACHLSAANSAATYGAHGDPSRLADIFEANDNETGCRECHATTPSFDMANHDATMFPGHALQPECKDCHRDRMDEPKEWAIDFAKTGCTSTTGCHPSEPTCAADNLDGC